MTDTTATGDMQWPQTSTRDPEDVAARLQTWMTHHLGEDAQPRVSGLCVPQGNGLSSETVMFEAEWREDGRERREPLVARLAPESSAVPVFPVYDLERQFEVMKTVRERSSVPVPRVYWSEPDSAPLGTPFFVMERIDGRVPPDIMPYTFDSWLSNATPEQRRELQDATVDVLAGLHGIDDASDVFAFLELDNDGLTPLDRHIADQ